ncbi:hypothetical protein ABQE93_05465 [Mycolicibacterium sp. XJ662]
MTVAVTVSVTSDDGGNGADPSGNNYGLASAGDKGPANIITEDPTCGAWAPINTTLAQAQRNGWDSIDRSIPVDRWTTEQRGQYDDVGRAMVAAADQSTRLVKITPHRVVRELYEQFIAYARAYADAIPTYKPVDNYLAIVVADTSSALANICAAITYDTAQAWAPLVPTPEPPTRIAAIDDPNDPQRFLTSPDPTCEKWEDLLRQFQADASAWNTIDAGKPFAEWNAEQRSVAESLKPVISAFADDVENLGRRSESPVLEDFAVLAAQYRRAFVEALPTYTSADSYLSGVAVDLTNAIFDACKAVGV